MSSVPVLQKREREKEKKKPFLGRGQGQVIRSCGSLPQALELVL
jgi:hypothetical protein